MRRPPVRASRSTQITEPLTSPPDVAATALPDGARAQGVLRAYPAFRRLWLVLSLSSFGDWLGLLATISLADHLADSGAAGSFAIGGVLVVRMLPALVIGPFAGAVADRLDRRVTMVVCDVLRFAVFASIPIFRSLTYLFVASFLVECISLFWISCKEAGVPNLVPPEKLETANQLSMVSTYGSAPVAALVFTSLATVSLSLAQLLDLDFFRRNPVDIALYFNAATFLLSAAVVLPLKEIRGVRRDGHAERRPSLFADIATGWRFIGGTPLIRGLVTGILGAFAAGGAVVALGRTFVRVLGGGEAAYGLMFGAVFTGLAFGMGFGPRLFRDFSRPRLFGISIVAAGASLAFAAVQPNLVLVLLATLAVGSFAGIAWIVGYTLLGAEVADEIRGRTFAAVQSIVRVELLVVLSTAPFVAGALTSLFGDRPLRVGAVELHLDGNRITLLAAGLLAVLIGMVSYRQMSVPGLPPLRAEILANLPGRLRRPLPSRHPGLFVAFEGGEGAGKSTQAGMLADALRELGYDVVTTYEPGGTALGARLRKALLDVRSQVSPVTEALLYAADRAQHVAEVVRPALERGAVVVTDRYVDSSLAYQAGGRELAEDDVERISALATGSLRPDVTVLLDLPPAAGLARITGAADRIESEPLEFHERVRATFLKLAERGGDDYLVADAAERPEDVHQRVLAEVLARLAARGRAAAGERVSAGEQVSS